MDKSPAGIISAAYYKGGIMDSAVLRTLEYNKFIDLLADKASSALGKELVHQLLPKSELDEVKTALDETGEAFSVLQTAQPPFGGIRDIREFVRKAHMGMVLADYEFVDIISTMYAMRNIKRFFKELTLEDEAIVLPQWAKSIEILGQLENNLQNVIDEHGQMRDDASVELKRIRREIKSSHGRIKDRLNSVLHASEYQKYFQDAIITMRSDRYVVPIKQEYRQFFPGIVHDQSASGSTLFIEPMAIVDLNNDVKQLIVAKKRERERILKSLSLQVAKYKGVLEENCRLLALFDFTFAKAKLAQDMQAVQPILNDNGYTDLKQARHPLIDKEKIVPIDIKLGREFHTLLITGPNTGGKTVSMKTLGLHVLMAQSGCFLPALSGSEISIYRNVFADIGDEQSIEQSLSTFSAHMTHLVKILNQVEYEDLLLLDELGSGTDPEEGAALAMSILEQLMGIGAKVVATTHYSELKTFAYAQDGIENASVEFDINSLRPTYRLLIGVPGASNAFAISQRLGLPESLIIRAKQLIKADHAQFSNVLNTLESEKLMYEQRNADISERQQKVMQLEQKIITMKEELAKRKEQVMRKAKEDSAALVRKTRRESEQIIKSLKEQFNDQGIQKRQDAIEAARAKIKEGVDRTTTAALKQKAYNKPVKVDGLMAGDVVYVTTLDQKGTVLSAKGKTIEVQLGSMKMNVKAAHCMFVESAPKEKPASKQEKSRGFVQKASEVRREIDIRGMMVDEAENVLGKYIDDAVMSGLSQILIIHGKGTGALRKGIQAYLKTHSNVLTSSMGDINEGGSGVTVVELK
jgi:DNA mismatch repair protein MutS2